MKVAVVLAKTLATLGLTWALVWGWYWVEADGVVEMLYARYVFRRELHHGPEDAEFVTMLCLCPVLAWLLVRASFLAWQAWSRHESPDAIRRAGGLDLLSRLAAVFILAWPVACGWMWLGLDRQFYTNCSGDPCDGLHDFLISATCLLLSGSMVWVASRCWRRWLRSRSLSNALS